jgi:hypothetical protein
MKRNFCFALLLALSAWNLPAAERTLGILGLTVTDSARVNLTHNDVEPLWIDVRYYDSEGALIKSERLTVRPKQIRSVDLTGGEARGRVRATYQVVGSPDGTIVGHSEFASASLELIDNVTGKSTAVIAANSRK